MGRLIDADAFGEFIKRKYKDGKSTDDIKDQMLFDLAFQPTAYDAEKVVRQIKELSIREFGEIRTEDVLCIVKSGGVK